MDFAPPFQMSHPKAFEAASSLSAMAPAGLEALRKAIHHHLPVPTFRLMSSRKAPVMVSTWALGEWIEKVEEDAKAVWERGQICRTRWLTCCTKLRCNDHLLHFSVQQAPQVGAFS